MERGDDNVGRYHIAKSTPPSHSLSPACGTAYYVGSIPPLPFQGSGKVRRGLSYFLELVYPNY